MKKMLCLVALCLSQLVFANPISETHYRTLKLSDLPISLQKAAPHSFKDYVFVKPVMQSTVKNKISIDDEYIETGRSLDVALLDMQGRNGYIVTREPAFRIFVMTRFGVMDFDENGMLRIMDLFVQGHSDENIQAPSPILPPSPTTLVKAQLNINNHFVMAVDVYNSRGDIRHMSIEFMASSSRNVTAVVKDENGLIVANGQLVFDTTGQLAQASGFKSIMLPSRDGAAMPLVFDMDFAGTTNYSSIDSKLIKLATDGYAAGELMNVSVENDGTLTATYTDSLKVEFAQIHVSSEEVADMTPYMLLYPMNVWTPKKHPEWHRGVLLGTRFLSGYLEKAALKLPDTVRK